MAQADTSISLSLAGNEIWKNKGAMLSAVLPVQLLQGSPGPYLSWRQAAAANNKRMSFSSIKTQPNSLYPMISKKFLLPNT